MSDGRRKVIAYDSRFLSVNSKSTETLPDYVRRIRIEKSLSTVDVERQSGNRISDSYVTRIENGYVTEDEIFAVARGKSPTEDPDYKNWKFASLFDDAQKLTPEQMREFEHLMEIARREVQRMLQEQAKEPPGASAVSRRSRR